MNKFVAIALFALIGVTYAGHHSVVDGDILHRVASVLSHGYGGKVILGYPEKAHLVDHSYSVTGGHYGVHGIGGHYGGHGGGHGYGHGFGVGHAYGGLGGGHHGYGGHGIGYGHAPIVSYSHGGHYGGVHHGGYGGHY